MKTEGQPAHGVNAGARMGTFYFGTLWLNTFLDE